MSTHDEDAAADAAHKAVQGAEHISALDAQRPSTDDAVIDVMARTIYGEARGYPREGQELVASVILNRASHPRWWGSGIVGVCRKPYQFSCWLDGDPNLPKMLAAKRGDPVFDLCYQVAAAAVAGEIVDQTGGADSYFDTSIPTPAWAKNRTPSRIYRDFRFYRIELPPL